MPAVRRDLGVKAGVAVLAATALAGAALLALLLLGGERADAAGATASGTATVGMKNFKFAPGTLRVRRGTRVVFSNRSGVTHNATSPSFKTGNVRSGRAVAVKFTAKGTYRYHCTIHPQMRGKIVVG